MTDGVLRVVLVDDEEADNYIHQRNIEFTGKGKVIKAFQMAENALEWIKCEPQNIDLIFLDINMPKMSGFEFLESYNKLDSQFKAKSVVVMLTSSLADKDRETAIKLGAKFETKPLTKEGFLHFVEKIS